MADVLVASNLEVDYLVQRATIRALDSVSVTVHDGEVVGVVGESGSGKSTLALASGGLLPRNAHVADGDLLIAGQSIFSSSTRTIRELRRHSLGFVFQDPISSLDPTQTIGRQLNRALGEGSRYLDASSILREVGLTDVSRIARSYPHQLSGGMAQRVGIARAIAHAPALIVADEPTSSLDVVVREEILDLLTLQRTRHNSAVMIFTHDLHSVARYCDEVVVMYAGRVVEAGASSQVFSRPGHPYTSALLRAIPGAESANERLRPIVGSPPGLHGPARDCAFSPRCPSAIDRCRVERPALQAISSRMVACFRAQEMLDGSLESSDA